MSLFPTYHATLHTSPFSYVKQARPPCTHHRKARTQASKPFSRSNLLRFLDPQMRTATQNPERRDDNAPVATCAREQTEIASTADQNPLVREFRRPHLYQIRNANARCLRKKRSDFPVSHPRSSTRQTGSVKWDCRRSRFWGDLAEAELVAASKMSP